MNWGFYIVSIVKPASKKIGALICYVKFLSPEAALYLYKLTMLTCMKHSCHFWAGASSSYFELLDKLQKWLHMTVGPSLAAFLEPLAHHRIAASLSLFHRYYWTGWTGSTFLFLREVYLLFWYIAWFFCHYS